MTSSKNTIAELRKKLNKELAQYEIAKARVKTEHQELERAREIYSDAKEAQGIIQHVSRVVQESAHKQIASVVSKCLEAVFDEPYQFQISFEQKRGKTEANLLLVRDGKEIDPLSAAGGGVVDLVSFALRLACLLLSRPQNAKVIVLDEPFKFVSEDLRPRVKKMIELLAEELEIQFVIVTHLKGLEMGEIVQIS